MLNDLQKLEVSAPTKCEMCGNLKLNYNGVGEYQCSGCGHIMYDDYGIVRNFLEKNPGATQSEVSKATGVSGAMIRRMLRDDKIQIAPGSMVFLHCEKCGADIRSGRLCVNCSNNKTSDSVKKKPLRGSNSITGGFIMGKGETPGTRRFTRDK